MMCKTCRESLLSNLERTHRCPPAWRVCCPEWCYDHDDAELVYAHDAELAAVRWGREHDDDYELIDCVDPVVVEVWRDGEAAETCQRFAVRGETTVHYSARRVESGNAT